MIAYPMTTTEQRTARTAGFLMTAFSALVIALLGAVAMAAGT